LEVTKDQLKMMIDDSSDDIDYTVIRTLAAIIN